METIELWPGDRVRWRKVEFAINSTWQDGTVDLWDERNKTVIENVKASELEVIFEGDLMDNLMDKLQKHEEVEPFSEEEAKAEYDEWQKQAIMDDKAQ